jgi:nicotinamide phosphoribosyltransferase
MLTYNSILIDTDAYKVSMSVQYPPNTETVYSYIETRGNPWTKVTWTGLQHILTSLTQIITVEDVHLADDYWNAQGLPFPIEKWLRLVEKCDGKLPIRIKAVPEGLRMKHGNVLVSVENTDEEFAWLTTWVETKLLRVWYPTTVATLSASIKDVIRAALVESADDPEAEISFKLHDFGARGVSGPEQAAIGGAAHLLNFMGTDTGVALLHAMTVYGAFMSGTCGSIPAAEHSTITSWGRENEVEAYRNMMNQFGSGLFAVVSDSYNLWDAIDNLWGGVLKAEVVKIAENGGMLIVRPDSGDPTLVPINAIKALDAKFGHTVNSKGYKVLNHVRVIQGDGINYDSIQIIINRLLAAGYSLTNLAFGMGGALLMGVNRDTLGFAMKCSAVKINGVWQDVYKDPIDAPGKKSKRGRLALVCQNGEYETIREECLDGREDIMVVFYENGEILRKENWNDVVARAAM